MDQQQFEGRAVRLIKEQFVQKEIRIINHIVAFWLDKVN